MEKLKHFFQTSKDKCTMKEISGYQLEFCCCGTDRCNTKQNPTGIVGGVGQFFGKILGKNVENKNN